MKKMIVLNDSFISSMFSVASIKNMCDESAKICELYQSMDLDKKDDSGGYRDV